MANIYEKQAVSDFSNKFYSHEGNSGQWLMKEGEKLQGQAEKTEDKAKTTYSNALNVDWQNSMNSLMNNPKYASDPKALQEESRKLTEKMSKEIVDDDVKVDFLVNAQLKGGTYINKAIANARKIEEDNYKSSLLDSIYAGIDTEATVLSNGISGTGDRQDLANAIYSNDKVTEYLYKRNPDGSYVFNDEQRRRIQKERENLAFNSFKASFDNLPEYKRRDVYDKIKNDKMSFGVVKDKDGNERELYLQDVVSKDTYNKYKAFASNREDNEFRLQKRAIALQNFQEKQQKAQNEFVLSSELDKMDAVDQLNTLEQNKEKVSDKYYKAKSRAIYSTLAITPKTNAETFSSLMKSIRALDANEAGDFIEMSDEILTKIEETVASGELLRSDKDILLQAMDKKEKPSVEKVGEGKSSFFAWGFDYDDAAKYIEGNSADESENYNLMLDYYRNINGKDYNSDERRSVMSALVEKKNRELFAKGKTKNDSTLGMINEYFTQNVPQKYIQDARNEFLTRTQELSGKMSDIDSNYKKVAMEVSDGINQNIRLKAQDSYKQILDKSDDAIISTMAQQRGRSVEEFNKDIDETAKKYGLTRQQVINKLKGAY